MEGDACNHREDVLVEGQVEPPAEGVLWDLLPDGTRLWRSNSVGIHQQRRQGDSLLRGGCALLWGGYALLRGRSLLLSISILLCFCSLLDAPDEVSCSTLGNHLTYVYNPSYSVQI